MPDYCRDLETFDIVSQLVVNVCERYDYPIRIAGSYCSERDDMTGSIQWGYCYYENGMAKQKINSSHTLFPIGPEIFDYSARMAQELLDRGKLVNDPYVKGATHVITVPWGYMAGTGEPAHFEYRCKLSDEDAFLQALKFKGRLKKL